MFTTPILFLVFNRPDTTARVFEQIRKIKPAYLYVAADGPRNENLGEIQACDQVRRIVLSGIDWECEIKTLFRIENLGCGKGPAEAISWFFDNVEEGIILEDDVIPTESFFLFCREMLLRFKNEKSIMHICGSNFQLSNIGTDSYYLSKLPFAWGWATWKRAWQYFDFNLTKFNNNNIRNYFDHPPIDIYWHDIFHKTKNELNQHVWDYQWVFAVFYNKGFSIIPQQNLVSNIGFGEQSTHTSDISSFVANLKRYEMNFKIEEKYPTYDPVPDINTHKLFKWEIVESPAINISAKEAVYLLCGKLKSKFKLIKASHGKSFISIIIIFINV